MSVKVRRMRIDSIWEGGEEYFEDGSPPWVARLPPGGSCPQALVMGDQDGLNIYLCEECGEGGRMLWKQMTLPPSVMFVMVTLFVRDLESHLQRGALLNLNREFVVVSVVRWLRKEGFVDVVA